MKRLILLSSLLFGGLLSTHANAAGGEPVFAFTPHPDNIASVQRGARDFMNYCSGCHSLKYLRYSRAAADLGLPEELVEKSLMFTTEKVQQPIVSAMPAQAESWFGRQPPDLSLVSRKRGPAWVYSFLNGFYVDPSKAATGVNNLQLPGASMPHVLWEQQGFRAQVEAPEGEHAEAEHGGHHAPELETVVEGKLTQDEYEEMIADLTNFLIYAAEPGRADRISLGMKVLFYMLLLVGLTYMLKREFWRDVH